MTSKFIVSCINHVKIIHICIFSSKKIFIYLQQIFNLTVL